MAQSTANPDFAFEVGKSYYTYSKKSSVTITKRSACYVSGVDENGEAFRRKILKYAATYEYNGDGRVFECFILHEHVHVSARDEFTAETATHALDDEPEARYLDDEDSFSDHAGDNSAPLQDIPDDTLHDVPEITPALKNDDYIYHGEYTYHGSFSYSVKKEARSLHYSVLPLLHNCNSNHRKWSGGITLHFIDEKGKTFAVYAPHAGIIQVLHDYALFRKYPQRQIDFIRKTLQDIADNRKNFLQFINVLDRNGNLFLDGLEAFRYCFYKDMHYCKRTNSYAHEMYSMPENPFSDGNYPGNPLTWPESPERSLGLIIAHAFMFYRVELTCTNNNSKAARKAFMPFLNDLRNQLHHVWLQLHNRLEREKAASHEQSDNIPLDVPEIMPEISQDTPAHTAHQPSPRQRKKPRKHIRFEVGNTYSASNDGKSMHIRIIRRMKKQAGHDSQNIQVNTWGYDALTGGQIPNDGKIWWCSLSNSNKDTVETIDISGGFIFRADRPDQENTTHDDSATAPAPVFEPEIAPAPAPVPDHEPATVNGYAPAQFLTAASPLNHIVAWRRSLLWLFAIFWVFCLHKSHNFNRNEAQNFHRPLGIHELRLTETRGLQGEALHLAVASNIQATLHASDRQTLADGLSHLSGQAVKKIGRQLGLLSPKEKGSGGSLGGLLAERLFLHMTNPQDCSKPKTYTDCKRQIVMILD